jgi:hypothetical protein
MRVGSTHNPVQSFHRGNIFDGSRHYFLRQVYFFKLRAAGVMFFTFLDKVYPGCWLGGVDWFHAGGGYVHHVYAVCVCVQGLACGIMYVYVYH